MRKYWFFLIICLQDENILVDLKTLTLQLIDFGSGAFVKESLFSDFDGESCTHDQWWNRISVEEVIELATSQKAHLLVASSSSWISPGVAILTSGRLVTRIPGRMRQGRGQGRRAGSLAFSAIFTAVVTCTFNSFPLLSRFLWTCSY